MSAEVPPATLPGTPKVNNVQPIFCYLCTLGMTVVMVYVFAAGAQACHLLVELPYWRGKADKHGTRGL